MTLDMLKIGEEGVITSVNEMDEDKSLRNHLLDMGLIPVSYTHLTLPTKA